MCLCWRTSLRLSSGEGSESSLQPLLGLFLLPAGASRSELSVVYSFLCALPAALFPRHEELLSLWKHMAPNLSFSLSSFVIVFYYRNRKVANMALGSTNWDVAVKNLTSFDF